MEEVDENSNLIANPPFYKKHKILIFFLLVFIIFIIWIFTTFPKGDIISRSDAFYGEVVISPSSEYAVIRTQINPLDPGLNVLKLINLKNRNSSLLPNSNGFVGNYNVFSPNSNLLIYPGKRLDAEYPGAKLNSETNPYNYFPYYNLYIYDISTGKSQHLTKNIQSLMYSYYAPSFYEWLDNDDIIYRCHPQLESGITPNYGSSEVEFTKSIYCKLNLNNYNITEYSAPSTSTQESSLANYETYSGCFENKEKNLCVYGEGFIRSFPEGHIFYQIYLKKENKEKLIYRGKERPNAFIWSNDNHIYATFGNSLVRLY